ncbi:MAG: helix-turn-helix domain-containing protein [Candidatus Thorarchaeota archaeon]
MSDEAVTEVVSVLKRNLGITDVESKVILPVYLGGNMTAGGVSLMSGEKLHTVEKALKRLVNKGMIKEIDGIVPVYRSMPPNLALSDELSSILGEVQTLAELSEKTFSSKAEEIDKNVEKVITSETKSLETIRKSLAKYEDEMLELVGSRIEQVKVTAAAVMNALSEDIEDIMNKLDTSLDNRLGAKLTELQTEIDKSQVRLDKDAKRISRAFDRWLKVERKTTLTTISEFETKAQSLIGVAGDAVNKALGASSDALQKITQEMTKSLSSMTSNASDKGVEILNSVTEDLTQLLAHLESELNQTNLAGQESLREVLVQARTIPTEFGEFTKNKINSAAEIVEVVSGDIDDWKEEVSSFMDVATNSVASQLDQVATTDANYIDVLKNTLNSHIEKLNGMISEEYHQVQGLATSLGTDCETTLADTRVLMLELLEKQNATEQAGCDTAAKTLHSELDKWVQGTVQSINKSLETTSADISTTLNTESSELHTLAESMNSRLKSAFNSIIKATTTKNETLITSVKKTTHDFEASVGSTLEELIGSFAVTTEKQVLDSKKLYQRLRDRLDKRMTQRVTTICSQADKIEREIDAIIAQQVGRIDQHTMGIREEFHTHLEDITRQFITLTQGIEATFNGLLSSQTVEARDLIASTHTEFKTVLKSETVGLKEDSLKLQQEYSTELGLKIDEVASSVATVKLALEELSVQKRFEISESMAEALAKLEKSIRSTEDNLRKMETGTINQFTENLDQVSQEFHETVDGARDTITERLDNVRMVTTDALEKSTTAAKSTADAFISEQKDHKQRHLANTSKKINRLATKRVKASKVNIEEFRTELSERETGGVKSRSSTKEEVVQAVEARRAEVTQAFDAASVWVDSTVSNLATSLETFGTKLGNEITLMQRNLQKTAKEASAEVIERGDADVDKLAEITSTLFQDAEATVTARIDDFGDSCAAALVKGNDAFTSMPNTMAEKIAEVDKIVIQETNQNYGLVADKLSSSFTEFQRSAESASEAFRNLLEQASIQTTEKRNEAIKSIQESANLTNQHAARKLETIGLELKTQLSTQSSTLIEKSQSDLAAKNLVLTEVVTGASNQTNEGVSLLRQTRSDSLSKFSDQVDKSFRRWSNAQKKQIATLSDDVQETIAGVTELTSKAVDNLNAIHEFGDRILDIPTDRTWYLSGTQEVCAHITDMARRAEESVVVSVHDVSCLDLKRLARIKTPKRRVLIVPETDETDTTLDIMDGWRIRQTKTPMLLTVIDDREILIGGSRNSDAPLAVVSEDAAYLKLYHDVLGPRLIRSQVS